MKLLLSAILLSMMLGTVSLAHAYDNEYEVYWVDTSTPEKQPFIMRLGSESKRNDIEHRGSPGWDGAYLIYGNQVWKGRLQYNINEMSFAVIDPDGRISMTFFGESEDRTGLNGWKGMVMYLNDKGETISHKAWIK